MRRPEVFPATISVRLAWAPDPCSHAQARRQRRGDLRPPFQLAAWNGSDERPLERSDVFFATASAVERLAVAIARWERTGDARDEVVAVVRLDWPRLRKFYGELVEAGRELRRRRLDTTVGPG